MRRVGTAAELVRVKPIHPIKQCQQQTALLYWPRMTDAELNSISEVLTPCDHNGKHESDTPLNHQTSYQMQINQYRNKHKKMSTTKSQPSVSVKKQPSPTQRHTNSQANPAADILVIGDSIIKHLQPGRLSRKQKVICRTMRGAKIEDVAQRAKDTPSECSRRLTLSHNVTTQRTPFGEILFSEALKKPVAVARDVSTGFRVSNQYYPSPQPIRHQPRRDSENNSSIRRMEPIPRNGQNTAEPTVRTSNVNLIDGIIHNHTKSGFSLATSTLEV